jgi:hypothetical protein
MSLVQQEFQQMPNPQASQLDFSAAVQGLEQRTQIELRG